MSCGCAVCSAPPDVAADARDERMELEGRWFAELLDARTRGTGSEERRRIVVEAQHGGPLRDQLLDAVREQIERTSRRETRGQQRRMW